MTWDAQKAALARRMYEDQGLSARKIAAKIGGVTRNAVIGMAYRNDWRKGIAISEKPRSTAMSNPLGAGGTTRAIKKRVETYGGGPQIIANATAPRIGHDPLAKVNKGAVAKIRCITELTPNTCKWPIGEVGREDFGYCGDQPDRGCAYCSHHASIAYESKRSREARVRAEKMWETRGRKSKGNWASFA